MAVVVEPELHPFASYRWHLLERDGRAAAAAGPVAVGAGAVGRRGSPVPGRDRPPPSLRRAAGRRRARVGRRLGRASQPLTQQRFLEAWVLGAPALPVGEWWPVETSPDGGSFQWGGRDCELVLPPLPPGTTVTATFRPAQGPSPLSVSWNGRSRRGGARARTGYGVRIGPPQVRGDAANRLAFDRERGYPPGPDDSRPLSVQLLSLAVRGPALAWSGPVASPAERERLGVRIDGHYLPETFGEAGQGVWLAPSARLELPAGAGPHRADPARAPAHPSAHRRPRGGTRGRRPGRSRPGTERALDCGRRRRHRERGRVVELLSEGYRPSDHGSTDDRELGVVLTRVRFEPSAAPKWTRPLDRRPSEQGLGNRGQGATRTRSP